MIPKRTHWNSTFAVKPKGRRRLDVNTVPRLRAGRRTNQHTKWRKEVLERDGNKCQFPGCPVVSKHNDAHHVAKRSQRPDLKWIVSNGKTLCREHHLWTDLNHDAAVELGLLDLTSYEAAQKEKAAA